MVLGCGGLFGEKGMAAKRRGRNVQELYNATEIIGEPKITSVLREGHRMEGPLRQTQKKYMVRGKGGVSDAFPKLSSGRAVAPEDHFSPKTRVSFRSKTTLSKKHGDH
ncbi:hypothetical protein NC651_029430 [Populus alba x Populus x berolinensis]|nr:hypothetical protein NC651_029430 [Populus alba x Populus x berolinensis]